ncbi:MAG: trypsin-like peptidase domain-containing protein [Candidatus Thorarchaeota archaeon]|nr:trypsin-like peptidase domain-containing protein [Candidatus Thorarchaeota archaeon]
MIALFAELERRVIAVVENVVPSVVSVTTTNLARDQFYRVVPVAGQGSGVVLTDSGFVVTNAHVVANAQDVQVTLSDGRTFKAVVVGQSRIRDLALLKIDATGLKPIELGDSDALKVGQFSIAVGNPLGLGTTVTFGMVSALERTIQGPDQFLEGLIQTSAQINPGNSGGALVDTDGKLIGVPTAMIAWTQGIGFALAVNRIKEAFDELVETGTVSTPWMGVVGVTLNRGMAANYGLSVDKGALLVEIPRGPAWAAGLRPGDVIVKAEGTKIDGMEDLRRVILRKRVGEKLLVTFQRSRDVFEVYVQLQAMP